VRANIGWPIMNRIQQQVDENTDNIREINHSIEIIKNNHLAHLEKDMDKQSKLLEKLDMRLWYILGLLVMAMLASLFGG
jgi:uncharacterized protein YjdB